MNTLYVSDLDGTLLNDEALLTPYTIKTINRLIDSGGSFSIATGRSAASALPLLSSLHIQLPIVLMNGVSVYDIQRKRYLHTHFLDVDSVRHLLDCLRTLELTGFLFTFDHHDVSVYYERIHSDHAQHIIEQRKTQYQHKFLKIDDFSTLPREQVIYFSICAPQTMLSPLYDLLITDDKLRVEFYQDVYQQHLFYLEVCSANASKYDGVQFLRNTCQFDHIVGFGDNLNDLPLFQGCDECYAVANAKKEVKAASTGVLQSNLKNGVAHWLAQQLDAPKQYA